LRKICVLKNKLRISFYNLFPFWIRMSGQPRVSTRLSWTRRLK
jgi:hypothetical protein